MDYDTERLKKLFTEHNGLMSWKQLLSSGVTKHTAVTELRAGVLRRECHGLYSLTVLPPDRYCLVQARSGKVIFSHATALFLLGYLENEPEKIDITVPQGCNVTRLLNEFRDIRIHYCRKAVFQAGRTAVAALSGFFVSCYELERSVCDMIRSRDETDRRVWKAVFRKHYPISCSGEKLKFYAEVLRAGEAAEAYLELMV